MHVIEDLAAFACLHREDTLPQDVREFTSLLILDLMAATAAGLHSPLAKSARDAAQQIYGAGEAQVWLTDIKLSIAGAAMANSAAASALDIDDGHRGAAGHAGAGIIPAALAVGQALKSTDAQIFDAIALGYDIALRVATARPTSSIDTYSSGRWVGYGVAATAGRLLGLNQGQMAHALGIAGAEGPISFATGTTKYQGSTVKEGIPPAVTAGLTAAFRAQAGATGPLDLLDNEQRFAHSILTGGLGESWWLTQCYLKPYACCRYMHAAVDAISSLRQDNRPISSLLIETFPQGLKLSNERAPITLEGGQYSFYFSCALAALRGASALQPVDLASLQDQEVLALAAKIELVAAPDFVSSFPVSTPARVTIEQGNGPESVTVPYALGDVANPMNRYQVTDKFRRISTASINAQQQAAIIAASENLTIAGFAPLYIALTNEAASIE